MRRRAEKTVDEQVEDLRERMRLLKGDRQANIDVLEASKAANREEIKRLRGENKEVRKRLAAVKRDNDRGQGTAASEVGALQREVDKLRKQHDALRARSAAHSATLRELRDELRSIELESTRPSRKDGPVARNIRELENRLDEAAIKYNEAASIKKTYEQIVKRLREERVGFDHQLSSIERTHAAKERDYRELLLLSGDAKHAREAAKHELGRARRGYEAARKRREQDLRERHQVMQAREQIKRWEERREAVRSKAAAESTGDLGADAERSLKASLERNAAAQARAGREKLEHQSKIDIFENAFRKIKEATGVSDVNEVIQKIVTQESTAENLLLLTKEHQAKVERYNEARNALCRRIEEVKYSGASSGHRRKMVDEREGQVAASSARLERARLKHERLEKSLISVKAGVEHLADKLAASREELGIPGVSLSDETVVDALRQCEEVLAAMTQRVRSAEEGGALARPAGGARRAAEQPELGAAFGHVTDLEVMHARPYNQRIELPALGVGSGRSAAPNEEGVLEMEDDELTRERIKMASSHIMNREERKHRRRPRRRL